jgi:putative ATPase
VTNEYVPSCLQGEIILRKEGDVSDKLWDEDSLRRWEEVENRGQEWAGRYQDSGQGSERESKVISNIT